MAGAEALCIPPLCPSGMTLWSFFQASKNSHCTTNSLVLPHDLEHVPEVLGILGGLPVLGTGGIVRAPKGDQNSSFSLPCLVSPANQRIKHSTASSICSMAQPPCLTPGVVPFQGHYNPFSTLFADPSAGPISVLWWGSPWVEPAPQLWCHKQLRRGKKQLSLSFSQLVAALCHNQLAEPGGVQVLCCTAGPAPWTPAFPSVWHILCWQLNRSAKVSENWKNPGKHK